MDITELKIEVNEFIEALTEEGDRRRLTQLANALRELSKIATDSLNEFGDDLDDEYTDEDEELTTPASEEIDDGDFGDDLGDGVEEE
jgi:hypothetical protein